MSVTIMFLSYERKEIAWSLLEHNLKNAGSDDYELMICDQGTEDRAWVDRLESHFKPAYMRKNKYNEGIARALNQMMIRRKHKHCLFLPNDFRLSDNWLKRSIEYLEDIPNSGVVGFNWEGRINLPSTTLKGLSGKEYAVECEKEFIFDGSQVMGATFFTENLINQIGYLDEDLGSNYGFEDQLICFRAKVAGLDNYYITDILAEHVCDNDLEMDPVYKAQKEQMLYSSVGYFRWKSQNLHKTGIYVPAPIKRPDIA